MNALALTSAERDSLIASHRILCIAVASPPVVSSREMEILEGKAPKCQRCSKAPCTRKLAGGYHWHCQTCRDFLNERQRRVRAEARAREGRIAR